MGTNKGDDTYIRMSPLVPLSGPFRRELVIVLQMKYIHLN